MTRNSLKARLIPHAAEAGRQRHRARWHVLLGLLGPMVLAMLLPTPTAALRTLWSVNRPIAVMEALALVALTSIVWGLAAWALVIASATVALRVGGRPQTWAAILLRRLVPVTTRRLVTLAAGVSVISGLGACASPAELTPAASAPSATSVTTHIDSDMSALESTSAAFDIDLDWLVEPPASAEPPAEIPARELPSPSAASGRSESVPATPQQVQRLPDPVTAMAPSSESTAPTTISATARNQDELATALPILSATSPPVATNTATTVTVAPGDCLWTIAARHLPPTASAAETAAATTTWYETNVETIGPDANLLLPGQVLTIPTR